MEKTKRKSPLLQFIADSENVLRQKLRFKTTETLPRFFQSLRAHTCARGVVSQKRAQGRLSNVAFDSEGDLQVHASRGTTHGGVEGGREREDLSFFFVCGAEVNKVTEGLFLSMRIFHIQKNKTKNPHAHN